MNAPRIASLAVALLLTASVDLLAQQQEPPVAPGDRVRVTAPTYSLDRQVGTVVEMGANSYTLQYGTLDYRLSVSIASLTKLEVSRGTKSRALMGFGFGFLGGAAVGFVFGSLGLEGGEDRFSDQVLPFAVVGGAAGFTVGVLSKTDRWEEVPLDQLRVGMATSHGNRGVAISVRFAF